MTPINNPNNSKPIQIYQIDFQIIKTTQIHLKLKKQVIKTKVIVWVVWHVEIHMCETTIFCLEVLVTMEHQHKN